MTNNQPPTEATLQQVCKSILEKHPDKIIKYNLGETGYLGLFVGDAMKELKGKADPKELTTTIKSLLSKLTEDNNPAITAGEYKFEIDETFENPYTGQTSIRYAIKCGEIQIATIWAENEFRNKLTAKTIHGKCIAELFAQAANLTQKHGPLTELVERLERAEAEIQKYKGLYKFVCGDRDRWQTAFSSFERVATHEIAELEKQNKELTNALYTAVSNLQGPTNEITKSEFEHISLVLKNNLQ